MVDAQFKADTLLRLAEKQIRLARPWPIGDGANDLKMMQAAVGYRLTTPNRKWNESAGGDPACGSDGRAVYSHRQPETRKCDNERLSKTWQKRQNGHLCAMSAGGLSALAGAVQRPVMPGTPSRCVWPRRPQRRATIALRVAARRRQQGTEAVGISLEALPRFTTGFRSSTACWAAAWCPAAPF